MKKLIAPFFVIVIALAAGIGAYGHSHATSSPTPIPVVTASPQVNDITYQGQDGTDAMTLLQATHKVDLKQYSFGPMVTGIDGLANTTSKSWMFYVNGTSASVGAKDYVSKSTDKLEWRYESVTQ